uniref:Uncharacterized protein n=1 Tax=Anopheles dirus TaxID=7168 RepID=A0A182N0Z1_9DIPT
MNRNGAAPGTNGGLPESLYISLAMHDRTGRATHHPNAGREHVPAVINDPAVLLAHYQSLPKDEVDWAAVAQQWIKMRESWIQPVPTRIPSPPPPPSFDRDDLVVNGGPDVRPGGSSSHGRGVLPREYAEEQGEAPMEVEWDDDEHLPAPPMPPVISGSDWPQAQATVATSDATANVPQSTPHPWNHPVAYQPAAISQQTAAAPVNTPQPSHPQISGSASAALEQWRAKNSHLFQSGGARSNPMPTPSQPAAPPTQNHRAHGTRHTGPAHRSSGVLEREAKSVGLSARASPSAQDAPKESYSSGTATINEAKRQLLPAWIREALERMERDKQRQLERELELRQRAREAESRQTYYELSPVREEPDRKTAATPPPTSSPTPPAAVPAVVAAATAAEPKVVDVQKKTKQILTEILLEATDELLTTIAKETVGRVQKRKGLGIYGDSDDEDDDNEDDPTADGSPTKKPGAGADTAGSDDAGSGHNSSSDELSDTEAMQLLKEKIKTKQRDFKATASGIEQWLEEANDDPDPGAPGPTPKQPPAAGQPARDPHDQRSDDEDDSDGESHPAQDEPDSGDAAPCQEFSAGGGRKRREKRVSRFSDPRDTVRQTYITHVSIVSATGGGGPAASKPAPSGTVTPASSAAAVAAVAAAASTASSVAPPKPTKSGAAPQQQQQQQQQQSQQPPVQPASQPYYSHYINRPGKPTMTIYSIAGDRKGDGAKGAGPAGGALPPAPDHQQAARDLELSRRLAAAGPDEAAREGAKRKRNQPCHRYRSPGSSSGSRSSSPAHSPRSHGTRSRSRSRSGSRRRAKHTAHRRHGHGRSRSRESSRRHRRERSHRSRWSRSRSRSRSRGSSSSKYSSSHRRF